MPPSSTSQGFVVPLAFTRVLFLHKPMMLIININTYTLYRQHKIQFDLSNITSITFIWHITPLGSSGNWRHLWNVSLAVPHSVWTWQGARGGTFSLALDFLGIVFVLTILKWTVHNHKKWILWLSWLVQGFSMHHCAKPLNKWGIQQSSVFVVVD